MSASFLQKLGVGRSAKVSNGVEQALLGSVVGSLKTAAFEPDRALVSAAGRRYYGGCQVIASGIAPVSAIPTTTATLFLWNGEAAGGATYFIEEINYALGSGTAAAGAALMVCVTNIAQTAPSAASNYATQSCSDGSRASRAVWGTAITVATSAWKIARSSFQLAAANVGQGDNPYQPNGALAIPPGYGLGIAILSGTDTSPLYSVSVQWAELDVDLE